MNAIHLHQPNHPEMIIVGNIAFILTDIFQQIVIILRYVNKVFDTPAFKRWSLILFPLRVGQTW